MSFRYRTVSVDVDVDLGDFDDEDIRDEYESRNLAAHAVRLG